MFLFDFFGLDLSLVIVIKIVFFFFRIRRVVVVGFGSFGLFLFLIIRDVLWLEVKYKMYKEEGREMACFWRFCGWGYRFFEFFSDF